MEPMPTREELPDSTGRVPQPRHADEPRRALPAAPVPARQADICRRHLPLDGRILEIGCATGDVLAELAGEYPVSGASS